MSNLSNQIIRIGHLLHEINMSFAAKGEFVTDEAYQMIQIKVKQGLVTVYAATLEIYSDSLEPDACQIRRDLEQMVIESEEGRIAA